MSTIDADAILRILSSPSPAAGESWNRRHRRLEGAIRGFTVRDGEREDVASGAAEVAAALRTLAEFAAARSLNFSERALREQGVRLLAAALTPQLGPTPDDARAVIERALGESLPAEGSE